MIDRTTVKERDRGQVVVVTMENGSEGDGLWYKDAIIYELHVRSFFDSNGDGIGDFKGLTKKLDYLSDLGVTAIWLLPFYPSPMKDDGYDISDYFGVDPRYGTLKDFKEFVRAAHERGMRVITELVLNHTSDQHPWFQAARRAKKGSPKREYYVWSSDPNKYGEARIIFKDFETSNWALDPVSGEYYWHRFYSHQPDLNYDSEEVRRKIFEVVDFWLGLGVDGLRLDAVPYLFEREGTNCENLPETHQFLKELRRHIDSKFKNRMLLAEANQWHSDAMMYFGKGDECHMAFHFPLMPRMYMAIFLEDRFPIVDILESSLGIPEGCQWALFLRNHDELTLEMVTDEERDYMYRAYTNNKQARINLGIRRRLAPLMENDRRKMELMNLLLLTLPGTPVIYYGDEIGMGDNFYLGDRNGVRTPMQWSAELNAGFSKANPQKLHLPVIVDPEYHYEAVNVENQKKNQSSLFWWMKRAINVRKHFKAFGRGEIEFLYPENSKILAFIRKYQDERVLVVANLSKKPQVVELDLSGYEGHTPKEILGNAQFPKIGKSGYILTFDPYGYYVFSISKEVAKPIITKTEIAVKDAGELGSRSTLERLEGEVLPAFLLEQRWFLGKHREIDWIKIRDVVRLEDGTHRFEGIAIIDVFYSLGLPEPYVLPIAYVDDPEEKLKVSERAPELIIAKIRSDSGSGVLCDASATGEFAKTLLNIIRRKGMRGKNAEIKIALRERFKTLKGIRLDEIDISPRLDQRNTSILLGGKAILKIYRKAEEGKNPEVEILDHLNGNSFPNAPGLLGCIAYQESGAEPAVIASLQEFIPNKGDCWSILLNELEGYFTRIKATRPQEMTLALDFIFSDAPLPEEMAGLIGRSTLELVELLAVRTAELHKCLFTGGENSDFAPEKFNYLYQYSLYQGLSSYIRRIIRSPRMRSSLGEEERKRFQSIYERLGKIDEKLRRLRQLKVDAPRGRIHGDYHLQQVLFTGKDVVIVDFEGEPTRALSERRIKKSPLVDVAGMLRSLHYAACTAMERGLDAGAEKGLLEGWARAWYICCAKVFLQKYASELKGSELIPKGREGIQALLEAFMLEKAFYELEYEVNNRPENAWIPIKGILDII
ncbi:MAG: maltose alpha-D-glucosyltransferase [Candidatus Methanosuratincola sp.]|nr:maltose alpha-D-glucosyltransferase [Candidatus Methanosuratincola sp.]